MIKFILAFVLLFASVPAFAEIDLGNLNVETTGDITAGEFYGDGSNLTGITGTGDGDALADLLSTCTEGQTVKKISDAWACANDNNSGGGDGLTLIGTFTASNEAQLDITGLDSTYASCTDYLVRFHLTPHVAAALAVRTSTDGTTFDTGGTAYSYSSLVSDNDTVLTASPNTGPKIYGTNGDNRAHFTPSYLSNLVSTATGIRGEFTIYAPGDASTITLMGGQAAFSEPDLDTDTVIFAAARETAQVTKAVRLYFRDTGGTTRNVTGYARLYCKF